MTPDRWRQIEALYLAALDRSGAERDALLSAADPEIGREVRSMLAKSGKEILAENPAWRVPDMIGVYRVEGRVGEGGMGMVYRAFDTRLNRPVAIKFLAGSLADANARRRFQREAQTASSLNHPHIVTVYDIGEIQDQQYLVTEFIEDGTLRAWVKNRRGWRPVVEMIIGVADALATAHAANILHRDIKPENVLATKSGYAKLTDFGLAKVAEGDPPNMETAATLPGMIMGTVAYMSPEQASGKPLDSRSDIFSFGVMLHELLSGMQPFTGATDLETLQRVIHAAPAAIAEEVPVALRGIIDKALEKDPADRYQTMRELVVDLRRVARGSGESVVTQAVAPPQSTTAAAPRKAKWIIPVVAIVATVAVVVGLWAFRTARAPAFTGDAVRLQVSLPPNTGFSVSGAFAVSPDGKKIVFSALGADNIARLWLRHFDSTTATPLSGTEHDPRNSMVFWSPDSRKIAFSDGSAFSTMDVADGKPQMIAAGPRERHGGVWGEGRILLGSESGIIRIDETTGKSTPLTAVDVQREASHSFPVLLPDGKHFLYLRIARESGKTAVFAGSVDATPDQQEMNPVLLSDYVPQVAEYAGVTQLLFYRGGMIYAQNFDTVKRSLSGSPVPVVDQVDSGTDGQARFSVSRTGVLVYRVGGTDIDRRFTWFDRQGKILGTAGEPKYYWTFKISPEANRVVYGVRDRENGIENIFVLDLQHGGTTRITPDGPSNFQPLWSPDGRHVSWSRTVLQDGKRLIAGVFQRAADASGPEEILISQENAKYAGNPTQWTSDGKYIISFGSMIPGTMQVVAMPVAGGPPFVAVNTGFTDNGGYVSPNNRWIVYRSNESGRNEMWVQSFPPSGKSSEKWMVSKDGALGGPRWRRDGRELVYISADGYVTAVPVTTEPKFTSGTPERLFQLPKGFLSLSPVPGQFFDATSDNQKFMALVPANRTPLDEFTVILNWPNAMKK